MQNGGKMLEYQEILLQVEREGICSCKQIAALSTKNLSQIYL